MKVPAFCSIRGGVFLLVQIFARLARSRLAVDAEQRLELLEQIGLGAEMAEIALVVGVRLFHPRVHVVAIVAMEGIAIDDRRVDALAPKDLLKGRRHGGGAGT